MKNNTLFTLCFVFFLAFSVKAQEKEEVEVPAKYQPLEKLFAKGDYDGLFSLAAGLIKEGQSKETPYRKKLDTYNRNRDAKKEAFTYNNDLARPYYYRALANVKLGKTADAMNDANTAILLDPTFAETYIVRGDLFLDKKETLNACKDYKSGKDFGSKESLKRYDENFCWEKGISYYKEGRTELNLGRHQKALDLFNESLSLHADSGVFALRSKAFVGLENLDSALLDITSAIELAPKNPGYYFKRGNIYYEKEMYDKAFEDYSSCLEYNPGHAGAYIQRGLTSEALSKQKSAIYDYTQAIRLDAENGMAYFRRGLLKETVLNDRKSACEDYHKAVDLGFDKAEEHASTCKKKKGR